MKIMKTCAFFSGGMHGQLWLVDTIEHEGHLWLVPEWLEAPSEGWKTPRRIICLSLIRHQQTPKHPRFQYMTTDPIPIAVFDGHAQPEEAVGFVVVEAPNIRVPIPKGIH
jgi:hypothetical protein